MHAQTLRQYDRLGLVSPGRTAGLGDGRLAPPGRAVSSADEPKGSFVRLEREIGLMLRRSRAISSRLSSELHPDLDGAGYGLLALLEDAGPLRASDLVARLGLD